MGKVFYIWSRNQTSIKANQNVCFDDLILKLEEKTEGTNEKDNKLFFQEQN